MFDTAHLEIAEKNLDRAESNLRLAEDIEGYFSPEYESFCVEMQGALDSYDEAIRKTR